jgi:hypothetical protein
MKTSVIDRKIADLSGKLFQLELDREDLTRIGHHLDALVAMGECGAMHAELVTLKRWAR